MKQAKYILFFIFSILLTNVYSSEVSIEDFFKDSEFSSVKISPDGRYFATYMEDKTTSRIVIIERESNKILYAHSFGDDMYHGRYFWLNNDRIGVAAAKKFGSLANPREIGQFLAFNADGSKREMIIGDVTLKASRVSRSSVGRAYFEIVDTLEDNNKKILVNFYDKSYRHYLK